MFLNWKKVIIMEIKKDLSMFFFPKLISFFRNQEWRRCENFLI